MRADRLLSILMLLQTRGRMTAHDLATLLEVSERTIYRDLEALGIAGIPIYTERGPGGGCQLVDGYQTRLTGLSESEVRALFLFNLSGPLADLGLADSLQQAMLKLSAVLPEAARTNAEYVRQRFHLDPTWWYHSDDASHALQTVQEALWQNRKLYVNYLEDDDGPTRFSLEPYGLVSKAQVWYLVGCCALQVRVLRVSYIQRVFLSKEQFERPEDFVLADFWTSYCTETEAQQAQYSVPLRLAPEEAPRLQETLSSWGYTLVEGEEPLAQEFYVLAASGEWRAVQRPGKEKKPILNLGRNVSRAQKKGSVPQDRASHVSSPIHEPHQTANKKKQFLRPNKKKAAPSAIKKTAFPHYKKNAMLPSQKTAFSLSRIKKAI